MNVKAAGAVFALILTPLLMGASNPNEDATTFTGDTDQLTSVERELLNSDEIKRVTVDPSTGDITAVEPMSAAELDAELTPDGQVQPFTAYPSGCTPSTRACWKGAIPSIDYGFSTGTTTGTWGGRANFWTGNYYAKLCWLDPYSPNPFNPSTFCMPERNGKNAWIELGYTVTGKQVNVSTTR